MCARSEGTPPTSLLQCHGKSQTLQALTGFHLVIWSSFWLADQIMWFVKFLLCLFYLDHPEQLDFQKPKHLSNNGNHLSRLKDEKLGRHCRSMSCMHRYWEVVHDSFRKVGYRENHQAPEDVAALVQASSSLRPLPTIFCTWSGDSLSS